MIGFQQVEFYKSINYKKNQSENPPQGYMPGERTGDSGPAKLEAYEKFCWYDGE